MTLLDIAKQVEKYTIDNSPTLLTGIGVAGVITTALLTGRAAYRMGLDLNAGHYEPLLEGKEPEHPDTVEIIKTYWPEFVPPVIVGGISIAAIIGSNRIGARRAAAVAAAYTLSEKAWAEYKEKVVEKLGEKKNQAIHDKIAQEHVTANPASKEVIITGTGEVMCYDSLTGRYFLSNMESIKRAENEINKLILDDGSASLSEFYDKIGLAATAYSEEVGWTYDNMLETVFSTVLSEDGRPCIAIHYRMAPVRKYYKLQ